MECWSAGVLEYCFPSQHSITPILQLPLSLPAEKTSLSSQLPHTLERSQQCLKARLEIVDGRHEI